MASLHPARRSAERFDSLLHGERGVTRDARDAELLELVGALQTLPRVEARAEFVSDLRERLVLAAETELLAADPSTALTQRLTVTTRRTPRERRLAIALGGFAIVGATTSMAVAAQSALPGDVLYPLKRAMENAEAGISVGDESKGSTLLANASGRLDEVDALAQQDDVDAAAVSETLTTFSEQATEASELLIADYESTGSEQSINELRDFTGSSIQVLAGLEDVIPAEAGQALLEAAQVLFQIDSLAADVCPACASLGITEIPVPLLASGDTTLDQAAIEALIADLPELNGPGKGDKPGKDDKDPLTAVTDPTTPVDLPTDDPTSGGGNGGGNDNDGPKNPLGTGQVSLPTIVPSVGVPEVDQVVSEVDEVVDDVVEGVGQVVGGLTGGGGKTTP